MVKEFSYKQIPMSSKQKGNYLTAKLKTNTKVGQGSYFFNFVLAAS